MWVSARSSTMKWKSPFAAEKVSVTSVGWPGPISHSRSLKSVIVVRNPADGSSTVTGITSLTCSFPVLPERVVQVDMRPAGAPVLVRFFLSAGGELGSWRARQ
ncbi:hypothetical protein SLA_7185 [Streptomyces laurentii]|uniref:Uncharacterized protein n=1 Tax=Streptomyces laurentii TaxID=39478 RepID=A0A160P9N7_STRLU|nr:hypothetical protein SLA_7185 [Streptomyces laurentii]